MTRKVWVLGIAGIVGLSMSLSTLNASACDESKKTANASTPSCCAKDGAKTASVDAKKVNNAAIKSAVVAPGAAPILNVAAFGAMMTGSNMGNCEWCSPAMMTAAGCATKMSASECSAKMSASECSAHMSAQQASASGCPYAAKQAGIQTAEVKGQAAGTTVASNNGCGSATMAMAGGEGCGAHATKTAAAHGEDACCAAGKTASLKGLVDEMPYKENKKVNLAGSYACGHCTLAKTEDCSPMFKTADGKVYPLFKNSRSSALKELEGKNIQVSGSVKKVDGVKYLEVKSYKVL